MISLALYVITTIYEVVTVPLYWRIIYVLITNKEFSAPFFQFLWIIGVCENIHYVVDVLYFRLPMFGPTADWFDKSQSRLLSLAPFLVYFFNYPVYFMQVAISFNRLTALWWPIKHKSFWLRWWRAILVAAFLVSFILIAHRLPFNATTQLVPFIKTQPELGFVPSIVKYEYYRLDTNLLTGIYNSIVVLLSVVINAGTFVKIQRMRREGNLANASTVQLEVGLFIIVLWMMCSLMVIIGFQAANFIMRNNVLGLDQQQMDYALYTIYLQQPWVDDVGSVSHPWVLILMSEQIRNAALPFLKDVFKGWRKKTTDMHSALSITNVNAAMSTNISNRHQGPIA